MVVHVLVVGFHSSAARTPVAGLMPPMSREPPVARTLPSGRTLRVSCVRESAIDAVGCQAGVPWVMSRTYVVAAERVLPPLSVGADRYELPAFMILPGAYMTALPASRTVGSITDQVCVATFKAYVAILA